MLTAILLAATAALAAPSPPGPNSGLGLGPSPSPAPSPSLDRRALGRLWIEHSSALTWPGLYLPAFTVAHDRRRVHRLTLGLDLPGLRHLSLHAAVVEPSDDPDLRARTAGVRSLAGSVPYGWMGVRVQIPRSQWHMDIGRSVVLATMSTVARAAMGLAGGWQVNLVRPLR